MEPLIVPIYITIAIYLFYLQSNKKDNWFFNQLGFCEEFLFICSFLWVVGIPLLFILLLLKYIVVFPIKAALTKADIIKENKYKQLQKENEILKQELDSFKRMGVYR